MPAQLDRAKRGLVRLIDGYADGLLTKDEFVQRLERLRQRVAARGSAWQRVAALEEQAERQRGEHVTEPELHLVIGRLAEFAGAVQNSLAGADRATQREIILTLLRRVEVDGQRVNVVFMVGPPPSSFDQRFSQHCSGRVGDLAPVARMRERGPRPPCQPQQDRLLPP